MPLKAREGLQEVAAAKINLSLRVTGRRADGYHQLESLVVFADFGDLLTFEAADALSLDMTGPFAASLPSGDDNLVHRAARSLSKSVGRPLGARITLDKRIPSEAGLGGGSADAAAVLRGLARLYALELPAEELQAIALSLGADVPVCLGSRTRIMRGIGEDLSAVGQLPDLWVLLAHPGVGLSTARVFAARAQGFSKPAPELSGEDKVDFQSLSGLMSYLEKNPNDLESTALELCPDLGDLLQRLSQLEGALLSRMTGSGTACFALFDSEGTARAASAELERQMPALWCRLASLLR